jgi:hypothetical protein
MALYDFFNSEASVILLAKTAGVQVSSQILIQKKGSVCYNGAV